MSMQRNTVVSGRGEYVRCGGLVTWAWLDNRSGLHYRTATVEHGDINVTKGELIVQIDPAPFQTRVNQAQANVEAARARL